MVRIEAEDAGGLSPAKDDNEDTRHFIRRTLPIFGCADYIIPGEGEVATDSNLRKAMVSAEQCESRLTERLDGAEQALLAELIEAQQEMESITALENFILGFRLGVRMMVECMDDNDGDIRNGGR